MKFSAVCIVFLHLAALAVGSPPAPSPAPSEQTPVPPPAEQTSVDPEGSRPDIPPQDVAPPSTSGGGPSEAAPSSGDAAGPQAPAADSGVASVPVVQAPPLATNAPSVSRSADEPATATAEDAAFPAISSSDEWVFDPDAPWPELAPPSPPPAGFTEKMPELSLSALERKPISFNGNFLPLPSMDFRRLSMRDAVLLALANNNDIRIRRYAPDLGDTQVRAAFGAFDPVLSISMTYNQTETPQNAQQYVATGGDSTATQLSLIDTLEQLLAEIRGEEVAVSTGQAIQEPNIFKEENLIGRLELGGKLPTGTRYGFRLNADRLSNDINVIQPPGIYSPEYASYAGVVLTQPLLRDFGFDANMAEVNVARANRKIGWYDWKAQMITSVAETLNAYIELLFAESDVVVKREAADLARLLERQNTRRLELGMMGPLDVSQAQSAVAEAEEREFLALSFAVERQGNLQRLILSEAPPAALWFSPGEKLGVPELKADRMKLISSAYQRRPDYLRAAEEVKKQEVLVKYNRNQVLPRVDAQVSYGVSGLNSDYGSSLGTAASGQGFDFGAGIIVSIPLGSVKERANLDASKMQQAQAEIALNRAGLNVAVDIDTALSLLESARARVRAADDFLVAALTNLNSEQALLEEGRSTTFNVIKFQSDLSLARTRRLSAQAEYRRALVRLGIASGGLLDEFDVNIEEQAGLLRPLKKNPPPADVLR